MKEWSLGALTLRKSFGIAVQVPAGAILIQTNRTILKKILLDLSLVLSFDIGCLCSFSWDLLMTNRFEYVDQIIKTLPGGPLI